MKLFFSLIILALAFMSPAIAGGKEECDSPACRCYLHGECGLVKGNPQCLVTITGPSHGGQLFVDILGPDGKSVLPGGFPRSKPVHAGTFTYKVGCHWLRNASEVYVCVDGRQGGDGQQYWSKRFRAAIHHAFKRGSHVIEVCLTGPDCGFYQAAQADSSVAPSFVPEAATHEAPANAPEGENLAPTPEKGPPLPRPKPGEQKPYIQH